MKHRGLTSKQHDQLQAYAEEENVSIEHILSCHEEMEARHIKVHGSDHHRGCVIEMSYEMRLINGVALLQQFRHSKK